MTIPFKLFISAMLLAASLSVQAQNSGNSPVFRWSQDPDALIVSYSEQPLMLRNADTTPRIRVFGDGRVLVFYPHYMKRAGEYEVYLNRGEVNKLLLAMSGVFEFNGKAVGLKKKILQQEREEQQGVLMYRSEDTLEQFEFLVDSYQETVDGTEHPVNRKLEWKNIASDAKTFPGIPELQQLNGARNSIRALLERDDLRSIAQPHQSSSTQYQRGQQ